MHTREYDNVVFPFQDSKQAIKLAGNTVLRGAIKANVPAAWRLVVNSNRSVLVEVELNQSNTSRTIPFIVAPNSIETFFGFGNVSVKLTNQESDEAKIELSLEHPVPEDQYQIEGSTQTIDSAPAFVDLNPNSGFCPALCNYVGIFANGTFRAQIVDLSGNVVWSTGAVNPVDQHILNRIRVPKNCKVQVRNETALTPVNFVSVWYRSL